jgi:polyisoprenoid-binding protein YceI
MKRFLSVYMATVLAFAAPAYAADIAPAATDVPAATYASDPAHTSLTFRINHMGMSRYTARFTKVDAKVTLDPKKPTATKVTAIIDPKSIKTDFPLPKPDFDAQLAGPDWLDAAKYPEMKFVSTGVVLTGPNTAKLTGDFTLHGVTKPVTLEVTFNGGMAKQPMDMPGARVGFSAEGKLKRSDFGMTAFILQPGSNMGLGDDIEFWIESELTSAPMPPHP